MNDLKQLTAITALNSMMQKGHFSICTIDSVAEMLGINPKGEAYSLLRPLHCIDFSAMPKELRDAVPGLIKQCLSVEPTYQFPLQKAEPVVTTAEPKRQLDMPVRSLMRLLSR